MPIKMKRSAVRLMGNVNLRSRNLEYIHKIKLSQPPNDNTGQTCWAQKHRMRNRKDLRGELLPDGLLFGRELIEEQGHEHLILQNKKRPISERINFLTEGSSLAYPFLIIHLQNAKQHPGHSRDNGFGSSHFGASR